jgi:hypothetical protein
MRSRPSSPWTSANRRTSSQSGSALAITRRFSWPGRQTCSPPAVRPSRTPLNTDVHPGHKGRTRDAGSRAKGSATAAPSPTLTRLRTESAEPVHHRVRRDPRVTRRRCSDLRPHQIGQQSDDLANVLVRETHAPLTGGTATKVRHRASGYLPPQPTVGTANQGGGLRTIVKPVRNKNVHALAPFEARPAAQSAPPPGAAVTHKSGGGGRDTPASLPQWRPIKRHCAEVVVKSSGCPGE